MRIIAITTEAMPAKEAEAINLLFDNGLETLHLRKPSVPEENVRQLIEQITPFYHPKIVLHDCFDLLDSFDLKGVHLNRRNPLPLQQKHLSVSRSCHSIEEAKEAGRYDYIFLSPVFDSISKAGYRKGFIGEQLTQARADGIINEKVIALGGMTAETIPYIIRYGFGGAAVLGALWGTFAEDGNLTALSERFNRLLIN
ncbi:Regulatory protein tenI [Bacteroidales bacterium Barb6]|nr:Regulatory protein tenI [Bacteroidales bacterium Barb6]